MTNAGMKGGREKKVEKEEYEKPTSFIFLSLDIHFPVLFICSTLVPGYSHSLDI